MSAPHEEQDGVDFRKRANRRPSPQAGQRFRSPRWMAVLSERSAVSVALVILLLDCAVAAGNGWPETAGLSRKWLRLRRQGRKGRAGGERLRAGRWRHPGRGGGRGPRCGTSTLGKDWRGAARAGLRA